MTVTSAVTSYSSDFSLGLKIFRLSQRVSILVGNKVIIAYHNVL